MAAQVLEDRPTWMRGPKLRKRWDLSNSQFYALLKRGLIPQPEFPFGAHTPYWRVSKIEAHEMLAQASTNA